MQWDAVFAAAVTVLVQVGLLWLLARAMQPAPADPVMAHTSIQVTWLPRAAAPVAMPASTRPARTRFVVPPVQRRTPPPQVAVITVEPTAEASRPMAAVYLMQARQNAQADSTARDPLADRQVRLPGEGAQRFRMRPPPGGVAAVVSKVGRLFGAEDAAAPCRETTRNINDLALDGDSAALQQQIERERRLCRP